MEGNTKLLNMNRKLESKSGGDMKERRKWEGKIYLMPSSEN